MESNTSVIAISYHSYKDPINFGLLRTYLTSLQTQSDQKINLHYITFEQEQYRLSQKEKEKESQFLSNLNINWIPIKYHTGGKLILLYKCLDFFYLLIKVSRIHFKNRPSHIIGFTSLSGVLSFLISRLFGYKLTVLNVEPHSEYMTDFGYWSSSDLKYKLLQYFENSVIRFADYVGVPTTAYLKKARKMNSIAELSYLPTGIDVERYKKIYSAEKRILRQQKGWSEDDLIFLYLGKFGGIYYDESNYATFFQQLLNLDNRYKLWVITPELTDEITSAFSTLNHKQVRLSNAIGYEELKTVLPIVDFGTLLVPSYPSQRYRCPIKTADYWSAGVPIIISHGVSDDYILCKKFQVGIVVTGDNPPEKSLIDTFMNDPKTPERCRNVARKFRNHKYTVDFLKKSLNL